MPAKAIIQSLLAILIWSTLAFLALQLSRIPPFLLIGIALCAGSLCGIHRISLVAREARGPPPGRLRVVRLPFLPLHGLPPGPGRGGEPSQLPVATAHRPADTAVSARLFAFGASHPRRITGNRGRRAHRHRGRTAFRPPLPSGYALAAFRVHLGELFASDEEGRLVSQCRHRAVLPVLGGLLALVVHFLFEGGYAISLTTCPCSWPSVSVPWGPPSSSGTQP